MADPLFQRQTLLLPLNFIYQEVTIFWAFTWRDWSAAIIPGMLRTVAALCSLHPPPSIEQIFSTLTCSLIYFVLYQYVFNIANQITGLAEDCINKPDRPLPSGRVSLRGAYVRLSIVAAAYLYAGVAWGVLLWTILWMLVGAANTFGHCDKNWFFKNIIFIGVGTLCLLQAGWLLAAPLTLRETRWASILSVILGITINLQDLRDIEGDKATGRRTMPIVLGEGNFRWVMAVITVVAPYVCWFYNFEVNFRAGLVLTASMIYLACRILWGVSKEYDHKSYMVLTYIFCGCVAAPAICP